MDSKSIQDLTLMSENSTLNITDFAADKNAFAFLSLVKRLETFF